MESVGGICGISSQSQIIQLPNKFSCVLECYGSDHSFLQDEVLMSNTISLTIYKVTKSYDGREYIYAPNNYTSLPDIAD